jgi:hypothetical protein
MENLYTQLALNFGRLSKGSGLICIEPSIKTGIPLISTFHPLAMPKTQNLPGLFFGESRPPTAVNAMLCHQSIVNPLGRMQLLARCNFILGQPSVNDLQIIA